MANEIYSKICAIMLDIKPVGKDKKNTQQNYQFRSIDDMADMISPILAKHGVFIVPEVVDTVREEKTTKSGSVMVCTVLKMQFSFCASDGSSVVAVTVGEGMDSGDKSCNKAMSAAFKYALLQVFCIPTSEQKDSEYESPEIGAPSKQAAPPKSNVESIGKDRKERLIERIASLRREQENLLGIDKRDDGELFQQTENYLENTGKKLAQTVAALKLDNENMKRKIAAIFDQIGEHDPGAKCPEIDGQSNQKLTVLLNAAQTRLEGFHGKRKAK